MAQVKKAPKLPPYSDDIHRVKALVSPKGNSSRLSRETVAAVAHLLEQSALLEDFKSEVVADERYIAKIERERFAAKRDLEVARARLKRPPPPQKRPTMPSARQSWR